MLSRIELPEAENGDASVTVVSKSRHLLGCQRLLASRVSLPKRKGKPLGSWMLWQRPDGSCLRSSLSFGEVRGSRMDGNRYGGTHVS